MLSANTAWLEMNTTKAPMNNVNFRKAVAAAINPQSIVNGVYTGIVAAANPTGLLPNLDSYHQLQRGQAVRLQLQRRQGQVLPQGLRLQGPEAHARSARWVDRLDGRHPGHLQRTAGRRHQCQPDLPAANARTLDQAKGTFDMEINNNAGASSDPWSYFDKVYQLPIGGAANEEAAGINLERFSDPATWKLLEQAATTNPAQTSTLTGIYTQVEKNFLQQLPEVPLWYNGAWFQVKPLMEGLPLQHHPERPERPGHVGRLSGRGDHRLRPR